MAFKMNPKSPLLMKAMGHASPAKNMNKGYGPMETSSPAKQSLKNIADVAYPVLGGLAGKAAKAASALFQEGIEESTQDALPSVQEVKPVNTKKGLIKNKKKELNRIKKKKPSTIESDPIKKSDPLESLAKPKGAKPIKTEVTAAEKLRNARKKMQSAKDNKKAARLLNRAERKNIKADKNERQMKRKQDRRKRKSEKNSPVKQTAKQKANLPKEIVNAIAAKKGKSPAKKNGMKHNSKKSTKSPAKIAPILASMLISKAMKK